MMTFKNFTADARELLVGMRNEGVDFESPRLINGLRLAHRIAGDEITANDIQVALIAQADQPAPMLKVDTTITLREDGITETRTHFDEIGNPN